MHTSADSMVRDFLDESVHFQTEDVLLMYAIIFVLLSILCATQLYLAISKSKKIRKVNADKYQGG